jgi:hypothetical protein
LSWNSPGIVEKSLASPDENHPEVCGFAGIPSCAETVQFDDPVPPLKPTTAASFGASLFTQNALGSQAHKKISCSVSRITGPKEHLLKNQDWRDHESVPAASSEARRVAQNNEGGIAKKKGWGTIHRCHLFATKMFLLILPL